MARSLMQRWLGHGRGPVVAAVGAALALLGGFLAVSGRASGDANPAGPVTPSQLAACPWLSPKLPAGNRASLLLAALTPLQEASLLHLYWGGSTANPYEGLSPAIPSLCVPAITEQDGAGGVASGWKTTAGHFDDVTQLPAPIADAAAFDTSLAGSYGQVVGEEDAAVGVDVALAPTINLERSPLWGRAYESLGEDPYLTGSLSVPLIDGIQSQRVVAVVKHFAAYNQETARGTVHDNVIVSDRALHEIYLPAWSTAIQQAHPGGVMCAYDLINGVPSCESQQLLQDQLRGVWGFAGFVRSDCGSVFNESAAFEAGVSQVKCTPLYQPAEIATAIADGQLPKAELDGLVKPLLATLFKFDLIAASHPLRPDADVSTPADQSVALRTDNEGAVLLKNNGLLPLSIPSTGAIALIGGNGGTPMPAGYGAMRVRASVPTTALDALEAAGSRVAYTNGQVISVATRLAREADLAIVVVHDVESEGVDNNSLSLPGNQDALVTAVAAANPRTIVVLETGAPVYMPWLSSVAAVLETWYPGQVAGTSLVQLLAGQMNPSGKLPVSWPAAGGPRPDASKTEFGGGGGPTYYDEGLDVGYRWYEATGAKPQFAFGYGLSYTSFRYSGIHVASGPKGGFAVSATVTNTGRRPGVDVAQCYIGFPPSAGEPPRQLRGFQRVSLAPGKKARVRFTITRGDLATWAGDPETPGSWSVASGRYDVFVGNSSDLANLPLHASLTATASQLGPASGPGS
jgi:beta-glucosidase